MRDLKMGEVMVAARVMPSSLEVDLKELEERVRKVIEERGKFAGSEVQPIAFGLKALVIYFLVPDEEGHLGEIEEKVRGLEGVKSFDVTDLRRTL